MKTIETTAVIGDDRKLSLQLPEDVAPGEHRIVVLIEDRANEPGTISVDDLPCHDANLVDSAFTVRRGRDLLRFSGVLTPAEADTMSQAIEEGCG